MTAAASQRPCPSGPLVNVTQLSAAEYGRLALLDALMLERVPCLRVAARAGRKSADACCSSQTMRTRPAHGAVEPTGSAPDAGVDDSPPRIPIFCNPSPPNAPLLPRQLSTIHVRKHMPRRARAELPPVVECMVEPATDDPSGAKSTSGLVLPLFLQAPGPGHVDTR